MIGPPDWRRTSTTYVVALVAARAFHANETTWGEDWFAGSTRVSFSLIAAWCPAFRIRIRKTSLGSVGENVNVTVAGPANGEEASRDGRPTTGASVAWA